MDHSNHHGQSTSDIVSNITASAVKNATVLLRNAVASTVTPSTNDDFGLFFPPSDSDTLTGMNADAHAHHGHGKDHSAHGQHADAHGHGNHEMKMWFHGGFNEIILFDFWKIDSLSGLILSCAIIFVMAAGYEALKWFRVYLQVSAKRYERAIPLLNGDSGHHTESDVYSPTTTPPVVTVRGRHSPLLARANKASPFAGSRMIDAALYVTQLTMAYWLMLIAMTYNTYLTAAVVLGAGFGHWLFAVMKCMNADSDHADAFTSDACH